MIYRGWNLLSLLALLLVVCGLAGGAVAVATESWWTMAVAGLSVGSAAPVAVLALLE